MKAVLFARRKLALNSHSSGWGSVIRQNPPLKLQPSQTWFIAHKRSVITRQIYNASLLPLRIKISLVHFYGFLWTSKIFGGARIYLPVSDHNHKAFSVSWTRTHLGREIWNEINNNLLAGAGIHLDANYFRINKSGADFRPELSFLIQIGAIAKPGRTV